MTLRNDNGKSTVELGPVERWVATGVAGLALSLLGFIAFKVADLSERVSRLEGIEETRR